MLMNRYMRDACSVATELAGDIYTYVCSPPLLSAPNLFFGVPGLVGDRVQLDTLQRVT